MIQYPIHVSRGGCILVSSHRGRLNSVKVYLGISELHPHWYVSMVQAKEIVSGMKAGGGDELA